MSSFSLVPYSDSESSNESESNTTLYELRQILLSEITSSTKRGELRKRAKYASTFNERKNARQEISRQSHKIKDSCSNNCTKKCNSKIEKDQREIINNLYWKLSYTEKNLYVLTS